MKKIKSIHFVGIKGVGMTPLAIIAKEAGFEVSGCDIKDSFITDEALAKAGIVPKIGFSRKHIKGADLAITTGAHGGFNNIEVKETIKQGIKVLTQGEAVGVFMEGKILKRSFTGISVAGTNGKTTTTAIIATVLEKNGLDPSYIIGTGWIGSLGMPGHFGKGEYFVAEADEYATDPVFNKTPKFLWQHPKIAIITNIEFDHPDVYKSIDEIRGVFLKFANQLPKDGLLITCGDDQEVRKMLKFYKGRRSTYGFSKGNDYVISNVKFIEEQRDSGQSQNDEESLSALSFKVAIKSRDLGTFYLNVFGKHNALNATASIIACLELGLKIDDIRRALIKFTGSKRRSEFVGRLPSGAFVFDDYAHNPSKVSATLKAFKSAYPKKRIICIFQPHTYSRTKSLFEQFVRSFDYADTVIITNIYASLREKKDPTVSSELLFNAMKHRYQDVVFLPKLTDVVEYIDKKNYGEDTIVITMGAGDVYKIGEQLKIVYGK